MSKLALFTLVMVLQACTIMAESDDPGVLEKAREAYRELKTKVVSAGSTVADLAGMYYEDHVKPVTDPYVQWAKDRASAAWERVKNRVPGYISE
ncbi:apolipoprotein C-IV [Astyanax mexicanus]|uniref:Apolipoprotein C-IV n=1 Tax=Astyanax mexicanus TaxID=7994 RepID=A0A3B1J3T8_ASTMX|nr:apolipoprotein C-IV [Astyanax mexicanus]